MRYVEKGESPALFEEWKACTNENWMPTYSSLRNPQKQAVHEALLEEQGSTCCYCGRRIGLESSHIEHFVPQEQSEALALEYRNLLASCMRLPAPPLHCGHAKDRHFDQDRCVSPFDVQCEWRFLYAFDGGIAARDESDRGASYMLDLLKLDTPTLRNHREAALLGAFFDDEFLSDASQSELQRIRDEHRRRSDDGKFADFAHVIALYAEQLIGLSNDTN
jgi:uncharacterized protein (TIGR02646 family)